MKRTFYRRYRKRLPRKLKKAVKYGVEHYTYQSQFPPRIEKTENGGFKFSFREIHYWTTKASRTKWKIKAQYACKKEYGYLLKEMYKRNMESIPNWLFDNKSRA